MHCAPALRATSNDAVDDEIAFRRGRRPDRVRLVALPHMQRIGVRLRINRDGAKPEPRGGARDAAGDLAAVGDQDGAEHGLTD